MNNNVLRIGVSPWGTMRPKCFNSREIYCKAGAELEILSTLLQMLGKNFEIKFVETDLIGCGGLTANGTWTGIAGLLERREVDISGNVCDLEPERMDIFGFSYPVWQYPQSYLIKAPKPHFSFNLMAPFQVLVWLSFLLCLLLWYCLIMYKKKILENLHCTQATLTGCTDMLNYTFEFSEPVSGKFYWFIWICFFNFLAIVYDSYIKAALLYSYPINLPFETGQVFAESLLSGERVLLDYRNPAELPPCFGSACATFRRAIDEGHYMYSPSSQGSDLLNLLAQNDRLVLPKGKIFLESYLGNYQGAENFWLFDDDSMSGRWSVFLWQKNFTLSDEFNRMLVIMGDYKKRLKFRYDERHGSQPITDRIIRGSVLNEDSLSLDNLMGAFFFYIVGIVVCLAIFCLENFAFYNCHCKT